MQVDPLKRTPTPRNLVRTIANSVAGLAAGAKREAGWALLALSDTPLPNWLQTSLVRSHQPFDKAPHQAPYLASPVVEPLAAPKPLAHDRATELLPSAQTLNAAAPARAVAFSLAAAQEGQLTLVASAPGTDWGVPGRESAVVSVFVDGRYNQDVVLYRGEAQAAYPLALGNLAAGTHTVTLAFNQPGSTKGASSVHVGSVRMEPRASGQQALVERFQPFFYGRGSDNNHSDTPLMMWCEVSREGADTVLAYSVMHSNEDGGTGADPAAEQASWGRETDPDPILTVVVGPDGNVKATRYLGWLDETAAFQGRYEGSHAILRVAGSNNSYDDRGTTPMLFRPRVQLQDFTGTSREALMERNPWTYKLSNEELKREGKELAGAEGERAIAAQGTPGYKRPSQVLDLRQYLYVDFNATNPHHAQMAVAVKLRGQDRWYRSDLGDTAIDSVASGTGIRMSVPLPAGVKPADIESLRFIDAGGSAMTLDGVNKAFILDEHYEPQAVAFESLNAPRRIAARQHSDLERGS